MQNLLYRIMDTPLMSTSAFDYLKDPLETNSIKALIRLYDVIPLLAQTILDEIADRLDDGGMFVQSIKHDYKKISSLLQESSRKTVERYRKDESETGCATVIGEYHLQMKMIDDLCRKVLPYLPKDTRDLNKKSFIALMGRGRIRAFTRKYISLLALIEGAITTEDLMSYKAAVIDKCVPMGQLKEGDTFMFPYKEHEMDDGGQMFTYLGLCEEDIPDDPGNKSIVCHYRKLNDSIHVVYVEQNALRAVLPMI